jgi:hypothetical protein
LFDTRLGIEYRYDIGGTLHLDVISVVSQQANPADLKPAPYFIRHRRASHGVNATASPSQRSSSEFSTHTAASRFFHHLLHHPSVVVQVQQGRRNGTERSTSASFSLVVVL